MSDRLRDAIASLDAHRARGKEQPLDLFSVIEQVAENAGPIWRAEALRAVEEVARNRSELTVEDLDGLIGPCYDRRAVGAVMLQAQRNGWIKALGWTSGGAGRHARPVRLWASRIYQSTGGNPT